MLALPGRRAGSLASLAALGGQRPAARELARSLDARARARAYFFDSVCAVVLFQLRYTMPALRYAAYETQSA